ncbi:MAG TPA: ATP-binding cassette domain-containing protein [Flavisolibacter sp.]|nr:ATP-binding cassette domain-containing protein [Flavisolibacter sp.]
MLEAKSISFKISNKFLLQPTSVNLTANTFHVIMGANGAGKSTLLKLMAGDTQPSSGEVWFDNRNLNSYSRLQLARRRGVLSQHYNITFPITAGEMVMMGRYPYFDNIPSQKDINIQKQAMKVMGVESFYDRDYNSLSGGEAQKVQMSRVLSQVWQEDASENKIIFLDEPVSHLDIKYQYQLLQVAKDLCLQHITVIAVLHDINLAISFADRLLFMKQGAIKYDLSSVAELTPQMLEDVFDVKLRLLHPGGYKPVVIF